LENSRKPTLPGQARCGSSCVEKYIFKSKQLYHLFHQITKCTYNAIDNKNIFEKLFGSILLLFYRYSKLALLNSQLQLQLQLVLPCPPLQVYSRCIHPWYRDICYQYHKGSHATTSTPLCVCTRTPPPPPPSQGEHTHTQHTCVTTPPNSLNLIVSCVKQNVRGYF
jgi:hypothetical protein